MNAREWPNYALICGLVRDELEFRITLSQIVEARSEGLFDGIVVSTWYGEIDNIPGLRDLLAELSVILVESYPPKFKVSGNAWAQHKAMLMGLRAIPDGAAVWRVRTDRTAHLLKAFRPCLEAGPAARREFGNIPPVFDRRVAAMAVVATVPFYAADFAFYGMKEDLLRMTHFEGVYDSLLRGFGAEPRLWTDPFLKAFPRFLELFERLNILGMSTHLVRAASEGDEIPEYLLYFLTFYWILLYGNIHVIEDRGAPTPPLTLRGVFGGEPCGALRIGAVASKFTVRMSLFNSQEALDQLVEGRFEDDSALARRYREILAELGERGMAALPQWGQAQDDLFGAWQPKLPDVELMQRQSRVSRPSDTAVPDKAGETAVLSGVHFRQMLQRDSGVTEVDDRIMALVAEKLALTKHGFDTGKIYNMIATEIFKSACDDRSWKQLGGFFLLRAAERGNIEAAGRYSWLVYSGRLEAENRDQATRWGGVAAVKEDPLGQYTCSLMCQHGWFGDDRKSEAGDWLEKAKANGFTPALLNFD